MTLTGTIVTERTQGMLGNCDTGSCRPNLNDDKTTDKPVTL